MCVAELQVEIVLSATRAMKDEDRGSSFLVGQKLARVGALDREPDDDPPDGVTQASREHRWNLAEGSSGRSHHGHGDFEGGSCVAERDQAVHGGFEAAGVARDLIERRGRSWKVDARERHPGVHQSLREAKRHESPVRLHDDLGDAALSRIPHEVREVLPQRRLAPGEDDRACPLGNRSVDSRADRRR